MKLTDYVASFLENLGVQHAFGLTGGAVVHFFDSLDRLGKVSPIFNHHEQAAAFAAQAYSRITQNLGACFVTTGPGGTNALTGLCAAWLDSVPCLFFSGQQRLAHTNHQRPFRQLGSQQIDIVTLVKPITKYAVMLTDPKQIKYELQKATMIAKTGRPGPVWIDIPLDFQWTDIDPDKLPSFDASSFETQPVNEQEKLQAEVLKVKKLLVASKRPLVLLGSGVRLGFAESLAAKFIENFCLPVVATWNTVDIIPDVSPSYLGCAGIAGQRGANLAVQNCDLLLAIGSHLSMAVTGSNFSSFAREAKKVVVNIDPVQLAHPTVALDLSIQADAKDFLAEMLCSENSPNAYPIDRVNWWQKCSQYKSLNNVPKEWYDQKEYVNPYVFLEVLSEELDASDTVVIDGGGTVLYSSFQGLKIKQGQRVIASGAIGCMGSGLPESIGACFARGKKRTLCMVGDGSMQLNIQELQTIVHHNLPIKIFLFNNQNYVSIRQTQDEFLKSNYVGSSAEGGVSTPDYQKVVAAYGMKVIRVENHMNLRTVIRSVLDSSGPVVCEAMVVHNQQLVPRVGFRKHADGTASTMPLEDMAPFLARKELQELMVVPLSENSLKE